MLVQSSKSVNNASTLMLNCAVSFKRTTKIVYSELFFKLLFYSFSLQRLKPFQDTYHKLHTLTYLSVLFETLFSNQAKRCCYFVDYFPLKLVVDSARNI